MNGITKSLLKHFNRKIKVNAVRRFNVSTIFLCVMKIQLQADDCNETSKDDSWVSLLLFWLFFLVSSTFGKSSWINVLENGMYKP